MDGIRYKYIKIWQIESDLNQIYNKHCNHRLFTTDIYVDDVADDDDTMNKQLNICENNIYDSFAIHVKRQSKLEHS